MKSLTEGETGDAEAACHSSLSNCVGAGRIDGWFIKSKSQDMEYGTGHVQSYCFEGNLLFRMQYSPLLNDKDYNQKDPVSFEVARVKGQCEAVSLALLGQEDDVPEYNNNAPWDQPESDGCGNDGSSWGNMDSKTKSRKRKEREQNDGRAVFMASFGTELEEEELKALAESVGKVKSVKIFWDFEKWVSKGCGKVFYETQESAERAVNELNRYPLNGRPIKVERLGQPTQKRSNMTSQEHERTDDAPKMLPLSMFSDADTPQAKLELCVAAFEDLIENHDPEVTGQSMIFMIRSLVQEVNNVLAGEIEALQQFGWSLRKHPWFNENGQQVRWQHSKNRINISKISPMAPAFQAWHAQQKQEQHQGYQQQPQPESVPISLLNPKYSRS